MAGFHRRTNAIIRHETPWDCHSSRWGRGGPAWMPCSLPVPRCLSHALCQVLQLRKPGLTTPIAGLQGRLTSAGCCPESGRFASPAQYARHHSANSRLNLFNYSKTCNKMCSFFFSWFSFISSITLHQKSYKIHETVNKIFNGPFWTASSFGTLYTSCLGSSVFFFSFLHRCRKLKSQGKDSPHTATPLPTCRTRSPCAFLITKLQLYLCQGKNKLRQIR